MCLPEADKKFLCYLLTKEKKKISEGKPSQKSLNSWGGVVILIYRFCDDRKRVTYVIFGYNLKECIE